MNIHASYDRSGVGRYEPALSSAPGRRLILKNDSSSEGVAADSLIHKGTKVALSHTARAF